MKDEEAEAIQVRWAWISRDLLPDASQAKADIRALLDERAELREVVRAVADEQARSYGGLSTYCGFCELNLTDSAEPHHMPNCPVLKARTRLEGE